MPRGRSIYGDPFLSDEEMFLKNLESKKRLLADTSVKEQQQMVRDGKLSMDEYQYVNRKQGLNDLQMLRSKGLLEGALSNGTVDPASIKKIQQAEQSGYYGQQVGNKQLTNSGITQEDQGFLQQLLQKKRMAQMPSSRGSAAGAATDHIPSPYDNVYSSAISSRMQAAGIEDPNVSNSAIGYAKEKRLMEVLDQYKGSAPGSVNMQAIQGEAFGPKGQMINGKSAENQKGYNPEVMQDGVSYALMLKGMDPEVIPKVWPGIANDLLAREPNLAGIINPNSPPDTQTLDSLLATAGLGPSTGQVATDAKGIPLAADKQPQGLELLQPAMNAKAVHSIDPITKRKYENEVMHLQSDRSELQQMAQQFDPSFFTYKGKIGASLARIKGRAGIASPEDEKMVASYGNFKQLVEKSMLIWRKTLTGTAGSPQEMAKIEATTLNMDQSPAEARASLSRLMGNVQRDIKVRRALLQKGIDPSEVGEEEYTRMFLQGRQDVEAGRY